jgi:hypothetical protein
MTHETKALQQAVEGLHNCRAKHKDKTHVTKRYEGSLVWEGDVYPLDLENHPTAKLAYAWSSPVKGSKKRKFYSVVHASPVRSAQDAVRASIAGMFM